MNKMRKTIAVDFDGVIHKYSMGWSGGEIYDSPVEGSFESIMELYNKGYEIVIFTARDELEPVRKWFWKWYNEKFPHSERIPIKITNIKPLAIWYIDDKGIEFKNWPETLFRVLDLEDVN